MRHFLPRCISPNVFHWHLSDKFNVDKLNKILMIIIVCIMPHTVMQYIYTIYTTGPVRIPAGLQISSPGPDFFKTLRLTV